jgi:hypothetical protein
MNYNLDCYVSPEELDKVRAEIKTRANKLKKRAEELMLLASYAEGKANAMRCRLKGNIEHAIRFEGACEHVYKRLPAKLRW